VLFADEELFCCAVEFLFSVGEFFGCRFETISESLARGVEFVLFMEKVEAGVLPIELAWSWKKVADRCTECGMLDWWL
jgi:hypothetical protein